jgi:lysophospholipid acyltransferase (LPLAT)-like uncharacterized protein
MKIRHPLMIKLAAFGGAIFMKGWLGSLPFRYHPIGANVDPCRKDLQGHYLYAVWHENLLYALYKYSRSNFCVLISHHADGQLLTEIGRYLRLKLVRGSTSRGSVEGLRKMIRVGLGNHLALAVDGPKGPRRQVQPGVIYMASRTGLPIIPAGFGFDSPWRTRTWDRMALPRPFARCVAISAPRIIVPPNLDKAGIELYRQRLQVDLEEVSDLAEGWAHRGKPVICSKWEDRLASRNQRRVS